MILKAQSKKNMKQRDSFPKVSVLLPIYNTKEEYLRQCIQSILNQSYTNFELLIINDSPENTNLDEIINSYQDERIKYFKNEKNIGITPSRNKLIDLAKGEYLAIMDHDDISLSERFTKEVQVLDNNSNIGVVSSWFKSIPANIEKKYPIHSDEIKSGIVRGACFLLHPAAMLRKSLLLKNNLKYEEEFSPAEDFALWGRLLDKTDFYNIPEILFLYREHEENTSKTQQTKMLTASKQARKVLKKDNPLLFEKYNQANQRNIKFCGLRLMKIKYKNDCSKYLLFGFIPVWSKKYSR